MPKDLLHTTTKGRTAVAQRLRCCATIRKVAGSIPTTSRQAERMSVRVVVFTLRSAVKVAAESVGVFTSLVSD